MAVRWAIASGNFSSTATWNDGATLGIPTTGDDVFTNSFTVAMDTNATVNSLNNSARARDIATPVMTSNNTPSPYVTSTSDSSSLAWVAFNQNTAGTNNAQISTTTGWYKIDTSTGFVLDAYTIYGSDVQTLNTRNWTIEGSNNDSTWTTLHTVTLGAAIVGNGSYSSPSIGNTTSYRYYRLNISLNGGGSTTRVADIFYHALGTAALASGGSFNFNTAGVTVSATSTSQGASNLFTVTHTSGNVNLSVTSNITTVQNQTTLTYSSTGNFNLTCPNIIFPNNTSVSYIIKTGSGTFTVNSNTLTSNVTVGTGSLIGIASSNGDVIINGNVIGNSFNNTAGTCQTIRQTAGNLTINGDIIPDGSTTQSTARASVFFAGTTLIFNGNTRGGDGFSIVSSSPVNINGNLNGGNSVYANGTININITGDTYAGLQPAVNCSAFPSSIVNLTGKMYNNLGRMAIWCPNIFISNSATTLWRMDTGGGNYKFLYSADSTPNLPATTNVRNGVTFGPALSLTGTMVVPSASDVRENVPVDNTVGTGELTSADIISGINASSDDLAVRLKNTLTDTTAGNIISQYNNS